ncbi:MAG: hypothetical protein A2265_11810 [Bacteroidetes bacterium RIFOXYA12_FULL_33_9]|nr:MAG: hypothetical protein A2265_11810 [Bacteroidetes bacterium RIFOXYA12_FULL_33_9]
MKKLSFVLILMFVFTIQQFAQNLNGPVPFEKDVRIGKFENGLTYYIRKNAKPENRVELRLAVNVGSLYETDEQQGLAHFTEHMMFNGTKNFPGNEVVNYLEKTGMQFGGDVNAYTSFAETVYMLQLPADDQEILHKGFLILSDWAHNASMEDKEIDKERGVIIEEWRLGLGADDRMRKKAFPVIFKDSRYADRVPIGKKEILEKFKYETIRNFYKDWYRPNLMAVIVVGNIDLDIAEQKVKELFGSIQNPAQFPERVEYGLPDNDEPLISIETDKEATNNSIMFFYKHPHKVAENIGDFKQNLTHEIYNGILNERLNEIGQKPETPYIMAYSAFSEFLARTSDAYMSYGLMKENKLTEGFEILLTESERVKQHGFLESEFERQKENMLNQYEVAAKEYDKIESKTLTQYYLNHFLSKDPVLSNIDRNNLVKELLPSIKLEDVNSLAAKWITDKNLVIMVSAPEKEGAIVPTKDELLKVIKKVKESKFEAYVDNASQAPLLAIIPTGSKIVSKTENTEFGFTTLEFENGVKAVLKTTDFKNDEILFSALSPGGHSLVNDDKIITANFATSVVDQGGLADMDMVQLEKKLAGKTVQVSPVLMNTKEGMQGNCAPKDFETLLQLNYLYFTQPRKDQEAFNSFISKMKNQMKFFANSPQVAFSDTLVKTMNSNSPRVIAIPSVKQIEQINLDDAFEIYKDRFADASDFTFFFVGNFNIDSITPMLETYLGGLPSIHRKETWKNNEPKFPDGITEVTINKGVDPKSMVGIVMSGKMDWNYKERLTLKLAMDIVNIKLRESLREDEGGVYGVQAMLNVEKFPEPTYQIFIAFGTSPKKVKKLVKLVFSEISKIKNDGPLAEDVEKVKETLIRGQETDMKKNDFWLSKLESSQFDGDDISTLNNFDANVKAVTAEEIKQIASKYFCDKHYVKCILMPEK